MLLTAPDGTDLRDSLTLMRRPNTRIECLLMIGGSRRALAAGGVHQQNAGSAGLCWYSFYSFFLLTERAIPMAAGALKICGG
jgi:hypothetical protein